MFLKSSTLDCRKADRAARVCPLVCSSHLASLKMTTPILFVNLLAVLILLTNIWTVTKQCVKFELVEWLYFVYLQVFKALFFFFYKYKCVGHFVHKLAVMPSQHDKILT